MVFWREIYLVQSNAVDGSLGKISRWTHRCSPLYLLTFSFTDDCLIFFRCAHQWIHFCWSNVQRMVSRDEQIKDAVLLRSRISSSDNKQSLKNVFPRSIVVLHGQNKDISTRISWRWMPTWSIFNVTSIDDLPTNEAKPLRRISRSIDMWGIATSNKSSLWVNLIWGERHTHRFDPQRQWQLLADEYWWIWSTAVHYVYRQYALD